MPAPIPPPQTSKQAKRAYQKSGQGFKFTASQERAAARRNAKDEYARKLREKEDKAKNNKRKRDEKEHKELEAKKRLIETGRLPQDALLPKVSASQPRLNLFVRQATKPTTKGLSPLPSHHEDDVTAEGGSDDEDETLVNENQPTMPLPPKMDEEQLEDYFSVAPSETVETKARTGTWKEATKGSVLDELKQPQDRVSELSREELEAQLGYPLSQAMDEFDICEDPLSSSGETSSTTPSSRKRKRDQGGFATPSKSHRSALSEMSPAKVFLRSQEKPDMTSAPSLSARMLSPRQDVPSPSKLADDTLAIISTQDIADEFHFSGSKENTDPGRAASSQRQSTRGSQVKSAVKEVAGRSKSVSTKVMEQSDEYDFDDSILEDFMDSDEVDDDYSDEITDAEWAGLSAQPPKNTAVSSFGSPKKAKAFATWTPTKSMAPPQRPSPIAQLVTKLKVVAPKQLQASGAGENEIVSASLSFDFDDGISDADLARLSTQRTTQARGLSCSKAHESAHFFEQELPLASQSFGLNDGMDDDMLAIVDQIDFVGSSATKRGKRGRKLPWKNRPTNWNAMMADDVQGELAESPSQGDDYLAKRQL